MKQLFASLSGDQMDCLQEIINISYGKATSRIATLMNAFATMQVPSVMLLSRQELLERLASACHKNQECFMTIQLFRGDFDGESLFLLGRQSAENLLTHLRDEGEQGMDDSIMELTNLVTSSLVSELARRLKSETYFNEPYLERITPQTYMNNSLRCEYDHIILINTVMEFKDQNIYGEVFILTHEKSFAWLAGALDRAIEELF